MKDNDIQKQYWWRYAVIYDMGRSSKTWAQFGRSALFKRDTCWART